MSGSQLMNRPRIVIQFEAVYQSNGINPFSARTLKATDLRMSGVQHDAIVKSSVLHFLVTSQFTSITLSRCGEQTVPGILEALSAVYYV